MSTSTNENQIEQLAALEHQQWSAWTKHFLENSTAVAIARWKRQLATSYEHLTEEEKEADRVWARKALACIETTANPGIPYEGKFLRIKKSGRWEYVQRTKASGIVAMLAITEDEKVLLIEQFRLPVGQTVVEIPAGLAGDLAEDESLADAARRELLEETGYEAREMERVFEGPSSAGLTDETVTFFRARGLEKTGPGLGDGSEKIIVHEIPFEEVDAWLHSRMALGHAVDCRVYTALHFENRARRR